MLYVTYMKPPTIVGLDGVTLLISSRIITGYNVTCSIRFFVVEGINNHNLLRKGIIALKNTYVALT